MKEFKYDVKVLIQGVKDRPCLWDRNLEVYKDRVERRNAWDEIFHLLEENYEAMPPEMKRHIGEHILNKWTNVRDTFVKSLKTKMGKQKRKYVLHDQLKFLINHIVAEVTDNDNEVPMPCMKEEYEEVAEPPKVTPKRRSKRVEKSDDSYTEESCSYSAPKKRSRKDTEESLSKPKFCDNTNDIDFIGVSDDGEHRLMNEDEAFFASLLPTVVKYNEDERLEFRIEVLSLMKKIKDNRKWNVQDT